MKLEIIIESIDAEIARLKEAKAILTGSGGTRATRTLAIPSVGGRGGRKGKRKLSPEALERIREGQRRRWAKAKRG